MRLQADDIFLTYQFTRCHPAGWPTIPSYTCTWDTAPGKSLIESGRSGSERASERRSICTREFCQHHILASNMYINHPEPTDSVAQRHRGTEQPSESPFAIHAMSNFAHLHLCLFLSSQLSCCDISWLRPVMHEGCETHRLPPWPCRLHSPSPSYSFGISQEKLHQPL